MGEMLSQAEIEALLNGDSLPENEAMPASGLDDGLASDENPDGSDTASSATDGSFGAGVENVVNATDPATVEGTETTVNDGSDGNVESESFIIGDDPSGDFTPEEIDAMGEIGNISMGNSATTLFSLLNRKVKITTPTVSVSTLRQIASTYHAPLVVVRVEYTEGLIGSNMLVLKESDVMVITDLMLGGDGTGATGEITELHLSAISEALNQMIGNSSTSLSDVFDTKIDISPPNALSVKMNDGKSLLEIINLDPDIKVAVVTFNMTVEGLLNTKIMQIQPVQFAKEMIDKLVAANRPSAQTARHAQTSAPALSQAAAAQSTVGSAYGQPPQYAQYAQPPQQQYATPPQYGMPPQYAAPQMPQYAPPPQYVNVQPANFQAFDDESLSFDKRNIGLVLDVPLGISVELGRTQKLIREILEFGQGSIIELDKLAGEPVDILVNGKNIARGEVVVIDESFGVRVTDIIHPSKRLG